jgi:hypothetical protein
MSSNSDPDISDPRLARLSAARARYAALQASVVAGGPWPLAEVYGIEDEAAWGPREVLAHVGEMLLFWLGEYERIVEARRDPGDGVPFGRTAGDAARVLILERDRTVPLRELFARVDAGIARWEARLAEADGEEGMFVGLHPRLGEVSGDALVERMILAHLGEHADQLEAIIAAG